MADPYGAHRPGYITGLRALADLLERHPEVPIPSMGLVAAGPYNELSTYPSGDDAAAVVTAMTGVAGRPAAAEVRSRDVRLSWHLGELGVAVLLPVERVCERIVTGIYRTRGQVQEIVEWALPAHLDPALLEDGPAPVMWDE